MILFIASGLLLLAATVKGYFLTLEAGGDMTQEQGQGLMLVVAESTLGLWLLSGWKNRQAHDVSILWFAACLCWSVGHWLAGTVSCGCAGRIEIPPAYSAGVVLLLLLSLIAVHSRAAVRQGTTSPMVLRRMTCAVAQSFVLVYLVAFLVLGSPRWVLAYFESTPVIIVPSRVELGSCQFGEEREVTLTVKNLTSRTVGIEGVSTTCTCAMVSKAPKEIAAGSSIQLQLKVHCAGPPNVPYHQTIRLRAVDRGLHTVPVEIHASLTGSFPKPNE